MAKSAIFLTSLCKNDKRFVRNVGGGGNMYNKIAQKLLSLGVSASMMLAMVPLGWQNFVAEAAEPTIPQKMFITKDDLFELCKSKNEGKGLLATGSETDEVLKINFGTRPSEVKYYDGNWKSQSVKDGPMTWLIAGSDAENRLVLYSERPIMSAQNLDNSSDSRFQTSAGNKSFDSLAGSVYDANPTEVYANHWGQSNLRTQLKTLKDTLFVGSEQSLAQESTITTADIKNDVEYTTKDKLYAPKSPENKLDYSQ